MRAYRFAAACGQCNAAAMTKTQPPRRAAPPVGLDSAGGANSRALANLGPKSVVDPARPVHFGRGGVWAALCDARLG